MNATVTLPISELDTLRDTIKDLSAQCAEYQRKEKQIKLITVEKQTVLVDRYDIFSRTDRTVPVTKEVEKVGYINMEAALEIIEKERVKELQEKIYKLEQSNSDLETSNHKQYKKHVEAINNLQETHKLELEKKETEIKILKGEAVDKDKDAQIAELSKQLSEVKTQLEKLNTMSFSESLAFLFYRKPLK